MFSESLHTRFPRFYCMIVPMFCFATYITKESSTPSQAAGNLKRTRMKSTSAPKQLLRIIQLCTSTILVIYVQCVETAPDLKSENWFRTTYSISKRSSNWAEVSFVTLFPTLEIQTIATWKYKCFPGQKYKRMPKYHLLCCFELDRMRCGSCAAFSLKWRN